jgi:hypothetical protein
MTDDDDDIAEDGAWSYAIEHEPRESNPHPPDSAAFAEWDRGWIGEKKRQEAMAARPRRWSPGMQELFDDLADDYERRNHNRSSSKH